MRNLITRKKHEELTAKLKHMREIEIPEMSRIKLAAAEEGDLRENSGYDAAKDKLDLLNRRAYEYEQMLMGAEFIEELPITGEIISVGTVVELLDIREDKKETYTILGPADSDPANGVISFQSPLAKGMIGKQKGMKFEIEIPGGKKKVLIENITVYKPE